MSHDDTTIMQAIAQNFLFAGLDEDILKELAAISRLRHFEKGETIFMRGDEGNSLYIILRGMVRVSTSSSEGREITLNMMEVGDVFGEISCLDGLPRTADANAMETLDALMMHRKDFMPILERQPKLGIHLLEFICERLRWTSEAVQDNALLSLSARLAKRLLYLATLYGSEAANGKGVKINLRLSQSDLGQLLGTTRESVNKQIQAWRKDGLVEMEGGHIVLLDRDVMEDVVSEG